MPEEKKKEEKKRYELVEISTQTGLAIKDNATDETIDQVEALIRIGNDIDELRKDIGK